MPGKIYIGTTAAALLFTISASAAHTVATAVVDMAPFGAAPVTNMNNLEPSTMRNLTGAVQQPHLDSIVPQISTTA